MAKGSEERHRFPVTVSYFAMAAQDHILRIDLYRNVEAKFLERANKLADLLCWIDPRIVGVRVERMG